MASHEVRRRAAEGPAPAPVLDVLDVLDALGEGALLLDGTKLVAANEAYRALVGYVFEELTALPNLFALVAPEELPRVKERYLQRGLDVPRHGNGIFICAAHAVIRGRRLSFTAEYSLAPIEFLD